MVATEKSLKVHLICKSAEHIEPLNLAFTQLASLLEWMNGANTWMLDKDRIHVVVAGYHPDRRYDPDSRELVHNTHLSGLWLEWEKLNFDPKTFTFYRTLAIARGHDRFADWGPIDHRETALMVSAQLAAYEGNALRITFRDEPTNTLALWRRLYWFTRFYRAWQRIGYEFTPSQFRDLQKKASAARSWKAAAWAYYLEKTEEEKKQSIRTMATNFKKQNKNAPSVHEVQVYLGDKINLAPWEGKPIKKTVG